MARTAVAYSTLSTNSNIADPSGTSISSGAGNGGQIAKAAPELTVLRVSNASGGSGTITLLAGANPPALAAGQGNLVVTVANSATGWVGPIESGRFLQSDGSLIFESSVALTVTAFKVPRH